uniref:C2H2-type domain-containing protein n=1 Tax=Syphacia muris TaxID=451379 RepID=A0A0N5AVN5_9BILA
MKSLDEICARLQKRQDSMQKILKAETELCALKDPEMVMLQSETDGTEPSTSTLINNEGTTKLGSLCFKEYDPLKNSFRTVDKSLEQNSNRKVMPKLDCSGKDVMIQSVNRQLSGAKNYKSKSQKKLERLKSSQRSNSRQNLSAVKNGALFEQCARLMCSLRNRRHYHCNLCEQVFDAPIRLLSHIRQHRTSFSVPLLQSAANKIFTLSEPATNWFLHTPLQTKPMIFDQSYINQKISTQFEPKNNLSAEMEEAVTSSSYNQDKSNSKLSQLKPIFTLESEKSNFNEEPGNKRLKFIDCTVDARKAVEK